METLNLPLLLAIALAWTVMVMYATYLTCQRVFSFDKKPETSFKEHIYPIVSKKLADKESYLHGEGYRLAINSDLCRDNTRLLLALLSFLEDMGISIDRAETLLQIQAKYSGFRAGGFIIEDRHVMELVEGWMLSGELSPEMRMLCSLLIDGYTRLSDIDQERHWKHSWLQPEECSINSLAVRGTRNMTSGQYLDAAMFAGFCHYRTTTLEENANDADIEPDASLFASDENYSLKP